MANNTTPSTPAPSTPAPTQPPQQNSNNIVYEPAPSNGNIGIPTQEQVNAGYTIVGGVDDDGVLYNDLVDPNGNVVQHDRFNTTNGSSNGNNTNNSNNNYTINVYADDPSDVLNQADTYANKQLAELKTMIDCVNDKFNRKRPIYTQYVKFDVCGVTLVDTTSTDWIENCLVSLINEQNGSGQGNQFTLDIIFKPSERITQPILEIELILNLAGQICKVLEDGTIDYTQLKEEAHTFQNCTFQYGYGDDPELRSPIYSGMILNYTTSISDGNLRYTITGFAGIDNMKEIRISTKDEYLVSADGQAINNPIDFVKRICEVEFQSPDSEYGNLYNVKILDNIDMNKVVAANDSYKLINDKNLFQAINDILASAIDSEEYEKLSKSVGTTVASQTGQIAGTVNSAGNLDYRSQGITSFKEIPISSTDPQCILYESYSSGFTSSGNEGSKTYNLAINRNELKNQSIKLFNQNVDMKMIGNRMLIATTVKFQNDPSVISGLDGDYLDVYWSDGQIWHCIKGDTKDQTWAHGTPAEEEGHRDGNYLNVVELIVNSKPADNPNNGDVKVVKIVNLGKYYDNPDYATQNQAPITQATNVSINTTTSTTSTNNSSSNSSSSNSNSLNSSSSKSSNTSNYSLNNDILLMSDDESVIATYTPTTPAPTTPAPSTPAPTQPPTKPSNSSNSNNSSGSSNSSSSGHFGNPILNDMLGITNDDDKTFENNYGPRANSAPNNPNYTPSSTTSTTTTTTTVNPDVGAMFPTQKNIFGYYVSNAVTEESGELGTIYIYRMKPRSDEENVNDLTNINIDFAWFGYSENIYNHLVKEWIPKYEGKVTMALASNINRNGINKLYPTLDADGNLIQVQGLGAVRMGLQSSGVSAVKDIIHNIAQEYTQWAYKVQYEYEATMTTIGIPCEFPLTRYIRVSPKIYDQEHPSAGIYMMKGKKDIINSSGFFSTWELLKYVKNYNPEGYSNEELDPDTNSFLKKWSNNTSWHK